MNIGAAHIPSIGCNFVVWAPERSEVALRLVSPENRLIPMARGECGTWRVQVPGTLPGTRYLYRLDDEGEWPDPASHSQPLGVHGPSEVVDHFSFPWKDEGWKGIDRAGMILYELHVGTFTPEGTLDAVVPRLEALKDLGVTAVELMPLAQFPGRRNWGYDGVYPFAVHESYGGPKALKRLVNACHREGLAVVLDVVFNHLGPEGNYLAKFGPYFTDKYKTPWGQALNFDDAHSDAVRNFFIENVLHWFRNFHIDGLRLDAVHAIRDFSAYPFLQELADATRALSEKTGRPFLLISESDQNDTRLIRPPALGGYGLHAVWCDDFHHALHTLITREKEGYYADFSGVSQLAKSLREGFVYSGEYSIFRKRRHGISSADRPGDQFVVFSQNHDQIGNRMGGERLSRLTDFESLKLCAGAVLLSPFIPLLFMGEEYGEEAPFLFFVSHSDADLIEAVRKGRREEFSSFRWRGEPPDPQDEATFLRSKIVWEKRHTGVHNTLLQLYKELIGLRKGIPALARPDKDRLGVEALDEEKVIFLNRWDESGRSRILALFNFNEKDSSFSSERLVSTGGPFRKILDSADTAWGGPGDLTPPHLDVQQTIPLRRRSFCLFHVAG